MHTNKKILEKYENLLAKFKELELRPDTESSGIESACKLGLQKLALSHDFAQIDEDILQISLDNSQNDSKFFTELLSLEAKRLRFKEEALKCTQTKTKTKIST